MILAKTAHRKKQNGVSKSYLSPKAPAIPQQKPQRTSVVLIDECRITPVTPPAFISSVELLISKNVGSTFWVACFEEHLIIL